MTCTLASISVSEDASPALGRAIGRPQSQRKHQPHLGIEQCRVLIGIAESRHVVQKPVIDAGYNLLNTEIGTKFLRIRSAGIGMPRTANRVFPL